MTKWFRFYSDAMRNPKVAKLSDREFRLWVQVLAVASENEGRIPSAEDLKHVLNARLDHLLTGLKRLISAGLIDQLDVGYEPHNWNKFQYKSDTSTDRVKKHRAERNVSETPPDTEQIQKQRSVVAERPVEGPPRFLLDKLLDALGMTGNPPMWAVNIGPIADLIAQGYDLDRDILPVIRSRRKTSISGWRYFVPIVIEEAQKRAAIPQAPKAPEIDWAGRMAVWYSDGTWAAPWGPKPDERGCEAPKHLMRERAA